MAEQMGALIEQKLRDLLPQGVQGVLPTQNATQCSENPELQRLSAALEAESEALSSKQQMYEALRAVNEELLAENEELKQQLKQEFERAYGIGFKAGSRGGE